MIDFDVSKTLDELENVDSGEPTYLSSLVILAHKLRKTPLKDWTIAELARMLNQDMSPKYLVPLAMLELRKNPLTDGMFYPGDILVYLAKQSNQYWIENPQLKSEFEQILKNALAQDTDEVNFIRPFFKDSLEKFNLD